MPNSKQIVYLSQAQYAELIANGSITVDGVTVTYDENDIYVTPQAEPITDVKVAGTSVAANGIAEIPIASQSSLGVVKQARTGYSVSIQNDGTLKVVGADTNTIKIGNSNSSRPILPSTTHVAAFYGLTRAAGVDMASSDNTVGTYTPEAKGAIQSMLGVSDLIATEENNLIASKPYAVGDVFTANGKLYKATAAIAADGAIIPAVEGEEIEGANCIETSVGDGFVKKTDYATQSAAGVVVVNPTYGHYMTNGHIVTQQPTSETIKNGGWAYQPITPAVQHEAAFYGLAKAAGADEKNSSLSVGEYTDTAKSAIRTMIGATSDNVIAVQDIQPTDTDTKIWLPETAETPVEVPTVSEMNAALARKVGDVQANGTSVVSDGVANIPIANAINFGVIRVRPFNGHTITSDGYLSHKPAGSDTIKAGTDESDPIVSHNQHISAFYGLAKAAGDTTQSASSNAVGTYTDEAKSAIRGMFGAVGDIQLAGDSAIDNGVANIPIASATQLGLAKGYNQRGIGINTTGEILLQGATVQECKARVGSTGYQPITVFTEDASTFYGLAYAAGDTTMASSSNAVGTYTDNAKASIKAMLGIQDGSTGTVDVSGTTPTITAVENTRYICGEVTSLNFTPPARGIAIVRFTSGSSVTVLTIPSTVKFPEWFDSTSLETNTIYEICVTDGEFGAVMSWAL